MSRVILAYGDSGVGKTTFAISGSRKTWYAELDVGSFERASILLNGETVDVQKFYNPLTFLEDMGSLSSGMVGESGKGAVQVVHRLTGWDEKYREFVDAYLLALKSDIDRVVIDTSTKLWKLAQQALRQRIQRDIPVKDQAERLSRLEYEEPNAQFHQIVEASKMFQKDLMLVAHEGEIWSGGKPTGQPKPDGAGGIVDDSDIVLRFTVSNKRPTAMIMKAGRGGMELLYMEIPSPTWDKVGQLIDSAEYIRGKGGLIPDDYESVITTAKVMGME